MIRPDYRRAEETAWQCLLADPVLPVRPLRMLQRMSRVSTATYQETAEMLGMADGEFEVAYGQADAFTLRQDTQDGPRYVVSYRADGNPARRNFTLAHEMGHILLAHQGSAMEEEKEADHFASCLLCPAPVLEIEKNPERLEKICYISRSAARAALRRKSAVTDEKLARELRYMLLNANDILKERAETTPNPERS